MATDSGTELTPNKDTATDDANGKIDRAGIKDDREAALNGKLATVIRIDAGNKDGNDNKEDGKEVKKEVLAASEEIAVENALALNGTADINNKSEDNVVGPEVLKLLLVEGTDNVKGTEDTIGGTKEELLNKGIKTEELDTDKAELNGSKKKPEVEEDNE